MALPGISNVNEFYSAQYLESEIMNDIKKVRERWAEEAKAQLEADPTGGCVHAGSTVQGAACVVRPFSPGMK